MRKRSKDVSWFFYLTCECGRLCVLRQPEKAGLMAMLPFSPCEADIRAEGSDGA